MSLKVNDTLSGSFQGLNAPGAISLPGARIGDVVYAVWITNVHDDEHGGFELTISVNDQIQQTGGSPLSSYTFGVLLLRPITVG